MAVDLSAGFVEEKVASGEIVLLLLLRGLFLFRVSFDHLIIKINHAGQDY